MSPNSRLSRSGAALALALLTLTGCATRPLTEAETAFLATTHGDKLDPARVRMVDGGLMGWYPMTRPTRPQTACRERIWPPETGETATGYVAGMVWRDRLMISKWYYNDDFLAGYPDELPLNRAMYLAHEMTHVWQWQEREKTGYAPWKAAVEHGASRDPYLFSVDTQADFLDYGYEQQASLVEEYVCCRSLDPDGARTTRLRALLTPVFPEIADHTAAPAIRLPWAGARTEGICSQS